MEKGSMEQRVERVKNLVAIIVTLGLGSALAIFFLAQGPGANPLGAEPGDSKRYLRDMEMYGGKANLIASQFREWVTGMLHGQSLAYTVTALTLLLALAVWFFGMPLPPDEPGEDQP